MRIDAEISNRLYVLSSFTPAMKQKSVKYTYAMIQKLHIFTPAMKHFAYICT